MSTAVKNNINKRKLYLFSFSFNTQNYLNLTLKKRGLTAPNTAFTLILTKITIDLLASFF
jgi:hypothetical protein